MSMKLENVKKHEQSRQHRDSEAAQWASTRPEHAPLELAIQTMERSHVEQMKCLFNSVFYFVVAKSHLRFGNQKFLLATKPRD